MLDFGYYNMDCMQGMKEFPDNYFDLAADYAFLVVASRAEERADRMYKRWKEKQNEIDRR